MRSEKRKNLLWFTGVGLLLIFVFAPYYWMVTAALRPSLELFESPPSLIPREWSLESFSVLLTNTSILKAVYNTILVAVLTTVLCQCIGCLAAYAISRFRFHGRRVLTFYLLITQMLPVILLALPFFLIFSKLGLYNTRIGLVFAYSAFTLPFCTISLIAFYNTVPRSLEESAQIDGCSQFGAFLRVVLPLTKTGFVATGFIAFVTAWNEYLLPVLLISSESKQVLVVEVGNKIGQYDIDWDELMALAIISSIPLFVIYRMIQKHFVSGLTAGAIKM